MVEEPIWNTEPSGAAPNADALPVRQPHPILTGGLDYTPAYFRRGYLQDDSSLILQPFLSGGAILNPGAPVLVQPYVTAWGSFGLPDLDRPMAHMAEGMAGVFLTWDKLNLDASYALYSTAPADDQTAVQEFGLKISYDVSAILANTGVPPSLSLRPYAQLDWETYRTQGPCGTYLELGLEPAWRVQWGQRQIGISLPLQVGLSAHDYYFNSQGENEAAGFVSVGLSASIALPQPSCGGRWFLSGSLQYMRLLADNLVQINHGQPNVVTGKVGIGFAF